MEEPTNETRASRGADAMRDYAARLAGGRYSDGDAELSADPDAVLADLVADLMHWADLYGVEFDAALSRGTRHYHYEIEEEEV